MLELFKSVEHSSSPFAIVETFKTCEGPRSRVVSRFGNDAAARREIERLERASQLREGA